MQAHERSLRLRSRSRVGEEDELDWARSITEPLTVAMEGQSRSRAQTTEGSLRSSRRPPDMFGLRRADRESAEIVLARRFAEAQRPFSFEVSAERRELATRLRELQGASPPKAEGEASRPAQRRGAFARASVSRTRDLRHKDSSEIAAPQSLSRRSESPGNSRRAEAPSSPTSEVNPADPTSFFLRPNSGMTAIDSPADSPDPEPDASFTSDGLRTVLSWNFPLPRQPRNCAVEVCVLKTTHPDFLQTVVLRVLSQSRPTRLLFETRLSIDQAHEVASLIKYLPQAVDEGSSNIQAILHNMFYEHDTDRNGSLSYDELSAMLSRLGLGIGPEDLNKLIAEADLDDDGRVDYLEFVSIAASKKPYIYVSILR